MYAGGLIRGWQNVGLLPGAYLVLLGQAEDSIAARRAGLQLKDTISIIGEGIAFAFLFRKPLEGRLVENILTHGTGGLNVDSCRVGVTTMGGRWPSNLILAHQSCRRVGERKVAGHKGYPSGPGGKSYQYSSDKRGSEVRPEAWAGHADADGMETVAAWECTPTCPVGKLDEQSGERPATLTGRADPNSRHENRGDNHGSSLFGGGNSHVYADSGGAARYYVQVAEIDDLLRWLRTLITPTFGEVFISV